MDRTRNLSRLFRTLKAVRRKKGKIGAALLLSIIALMLIGSLSVPVSGDAISFSQIQPIKNFEIAAEQLDNPAFTGSINSWTSSGSPSWTYSSTAYHDAIGSADWDSSGGSAQNAYLTQDGYDSYSSTDTVTFSCWWTVLDGDQGSGDTYGTLRVQIEDSTDVGTWTTIYTVYEDLSTTTSWTSTGDQDVSSFFSTASYRLRFWIWADPSSNGRHNLNIDDCVLDKSSGGTAYEKDLTETVDAADTIETAADFDRSYTEAVSAVDVRTTVADFARNLIESIGVVGVLTTLRGREKDLTESISSVDVLTNAGAFARDFTESVSAVDVISKAVGINLTEAVSVVDIGSFAKAIQKNLVEVITVSYVTSKDVGKNMSESISAIDAQSNAAVYVRDFVEAITAADSIEISKAIQKNMTESISASDVQTNSIAYSRELTENVTAVDVQINSAAYSRELTENVTAADTIEISKAIIKDMVETISAADVQTNAAAYSRELIENISSVDVQTNVASFARNLVESINVVDLIDAVKGGAGNAYEKDLTEGIGVSTDLITDVRDLTASMIYQVFFSLEMWGYLGPIALVIGGYFAARKETSLGIIWFIVECLVVSQYLLLVTATPDYWWHVFILLIGGLATCVYPLWGKR